MAPEPASQARDDRRRRLNALVSSILASVFILLVAAAAAGLWWRYEAALRDGERRAGTLAEILSDHLALRFERIKAALDELAAQNRRLGGPEASGAEWMPILSTAIAGLDGVGSLSVTDDRGVVTYSTSPETMAQTEIGGPLYDTLSANPRSDELVIDAPFRNRRSGELSVPVGRVLRTVNSAFEGMLVAMVTPKELGDLYRSPDPERVAILRIFHRDGQILVPEPRMSDPAGQPPPDLPFGAAAAADLTFAPIETGGESYLTAYRAREETGLTVAVSLPEEEILSSWWREAVVVAVTVALFGVLLFLLRLILARKLRAAIAEQ